MEEKKNKFIAANYKLYAIDNEGNKELVEETTTEKPFIFISGFGTALESFEEKVVDMAKDAEFDFELSKDEAFGDAFDNRILDLDKEMFCIDGKFDHERIYQDAIVPLKNEDGNVFSGKVLSISDDKVKIDLNHPLAGKTLNFKGVILENRDATDEEIQFMISHMGGSGCSHDCGSCGGCGEHEHGECGNHKHGEYGKHEHGECGNHKHGGCGHCH